jgi:hypothetical protein
MKRTSLSVMLIALTLAVGMRHKITFGEEFVYGGGVLGAGTGAIIGAAAGKMVAGVAIGGPVGIIAGYLIGDSLRKALDGNVAKKGRGESSVEAGSKNTEVAQR